MAHRLIWSPSARFDLRELSAFIADADPCAAQRFVRSVFRTLERLPRYPESGRIVPEFQDPNLREVIRRPCRIIYRIKHGRHEIEIARIWHSSRGIPEL